MTIKRIYIRSIEVIKQLESKQSKSFSGLDLEKFDLFGIDLSNSKFFQCNFKRSNLESANLKGSLFYRCDFTGCNLMNASMVNTAHDRSDFTETVLKGADFTGAQLVKTLPSDEIMCLKGKGAIGVNRKPH